MTHSLALIVEDEHDIATIFAKALRNAGYETQVVETGSDALTWLASHTPDLVVLDLQMPCVPGTEVLQHIRDDPRLADTRVIVATAFPHMVESLREKADWVLFKPISFPQLRDIAARLHHSASMDRPADEEKEHL